MTAQIIEIQPFHSGWQVRGVAANLSFFTGPSAIEHAIDYAWKYTRHRPGEIRLLARNGEIITAIIVPAHYELLTAFGDGSIAPPKRFDQTWVNSAPKNRICEE